MEVERLSARLEVTGLGAFQTQMGAADRLTANTRGQMDKLAAVSKIATDALQRVKMTVGQATESKATAEAIISGVRGISEESRVVAREMDRVRLHQEQAAASAVVAGELKHELRGITGNANETRRALESVALAGGLASGAAAAGGAARAGGSGFGGIGFMPAAIGLGVAAAPALGPAMLGLGGAGLAGGATAIGGLGTAYLAFHGLSKAIGGNKKAFDELNKSQQQFVQTLRGLQTGLDKVASNALLPGLTKALHEMFTPGLVKAMSVAVTEFGTAMGDAGQIIGRYFGSGAFADLLKSIAPQAAGGFRDLAHVFVSVADALGHVTEAALPMVNWLGDATVKAAALFDQWVKGKQSTGALGRAFDSARQSLQTVGALLASLGRVVSAFGNALYPVSTVLLKDLVSGLNYLAGVINRNKQEIRDIVGGALSALVSVVKTLRPLVAALAQALLDVPKAVGGWKNAFVIVLSGALAKQLGIVALRLAGINTEAAAAMGGVAKLRGSLLGLARMSPIIIAIGLDYFIHKNGIDNAIQAGLNPFTTSGRGIANDVTVGNNPYPMGTSMYYAWNRQHNVLKGVTATHGGTGGLAGDRAGQHGVAISTAATRAAAAKHSNALVPGSHAWFMKYLGYDPTAGGGSAFNPPPDFTSGLGSKKKPKAAPIISGANLIPLSLRSHLSMLEAQFKADTTLAGSLSGDAAGQYAKTLNGDLVAQTKTLNAETAKLKAKLSSASGKQKTAIQAEITKVGTQLASVQEQIVQNLQNTVQMLQTKFQSVFASVQSELVTALGNKYYQNGQQTPSETLLSQMQAQDQLGSLQDAISQATTQLATDKAGALMRVILDTATGAITNVMDPAKQATIDADNAALAAAKRQLAEYNLGLKAAEERRSADSTYAVQVAALTKQLDQWQTAIMNGSGSIDDLRKIAAQYGIQISGVTVPDFKDLSSVTGSLRQAFVDLITYIGTVTGKTPVIPPINDGYTPPGGSTGNLGGGAGVGYATTGASYVTSSRNVYVRNGGAVAMAEGGIVLPRPGGTLARIGEAGHAEAVIPLKGRGIGSPNVTVNLNGPVFGDKRAVAKELVSAMYDELLRQSNRNAGALIN